MIGIEHVTKTFVKGGKRIRAVDNLDWSAAPGTFCVVYGRSGSGKSTLLMMIGGMMTPSRGRLTVGGRDLYSLSRSSRNAFRRKSVGFIFQKFLLLSYFTVYENIALPLAMKRTDGARDRIVGLARELDLADRLDHYPSELSVGQQQRVAMARALVKDPDIILADEPTGNLDRESGDIIVERLVAAAAAGKTVIAATHDVHLLERAGHRLHLVDGQGDPQP
jgi:putative ABC transport system ATP-binding protein